MKKSTNLILGLQLAALLVVFILCLPHKTLRTQGTESDLGYYYIPMARELATKYFGDEAYQDREYTWNFHGPVYPLMLLLGKKTLGPDTDWGYFSWAKIYSAVAGGSIIFLALLWLGIPGGLLAAISLMFTYLFMECSFSGGTDLVSVAMLLWSAYLISGEKIPYWKALVSGILFAFCVDMRHEFVVLLPLALYFFLKRAGESGDYSVSTEKKLKLYKFNIPSTLLLFIVPFILIIVPDMPHWNGTYNAAYKYKSGEARWQDLWPEEAYTEQSTDEVTDTYWGYLIHKSDEKYPSIGSVLFTDPHKNAVIWLRDITSGFRDILAVWILPFLSIAFAIYLTRREKTKAFALFGKCCILAVPLHFLMITTFGVYVDRYYLLEIIALTFAGSVAFFNLIPTGKKGVWVLLITLPFFYLGGVETQRVIKWNIQKSGDQFIRYREIVKPANDQAHPVMMSRDPAIPYIAGAEWHQFPKGLSNLHQYCLNRGIRYVRWGSKEAIFRSEYSNILDYPEDVEPEFSLIDRKNGLLYHVNDLDSIDTE